MDSSGVVLVYFAAKKRYSHHIEPVGWLVSLLSCVAFLIKHFNGDCVLSVGRGFVLNIGSDRK